MIGSELNANRQGVLMLSLHRIDRDLHAGRYEALLGAVLAPGPKISLPLKARLAAHPAAVLALALRRLVELTYGPTTLSRALLERLLALQEADGSFNHDPLPTACAVAALTQVLAEHGAQEAERGPRALDGATVVQARDRALEALVGMQAPAGEVGFVYSDDRTVEDRARVAAFILWLLGDGRGVQGALRLTDSFAWLADHADQLDEPTWELWELARLDRRPTCGGGVPALAA